MATVNLASTTFTQPVAAGDTILYLASTSGIFPGVFLFANREAMKVEYISGVNSGVKVRRGVAGTATRVHSPLETVYIALGSQLYEQDPQGVPSAGVYVSPHINVLNGNVWVPTGDETQDGSQARMWQLVTSSPGAGALGVRVNPVTTPS